MTHDDAVAPFEYNYKTRQELIDSGGEVFAGPGEKGALSVFVRDGDTVLHTYSDYGEVTALFFITDTYLDMTPLSGRDEVPMRHHDRYEAQ